MANTIHNTVSRRAALAGTAAGAVAIAAGTGHAVQPALADEAPDPTFAAIEAHNAAGKRLEAVCAREDQLETELPKEARRSDCMMMELNIVETDDPRWIELTRAWHEACTACDERAWAFVENPPTTAAGVAALTAHMEEASEGWFPEGCAETIWRILAKSSARIAGGVS